jgi:hypothetical protein
MDQEVSSPPAQKAFIGPFPEPVQQALCFLNPEHFTVDKSERERSRFFNRILSEALIYKVLPPRPLHHPWPEVKESVSYLT